MATNAAAPAFTFGQNWLRYSRQIDEGRLADARRSLCTLLQRSSLESVTFLDIGAGSGLFSIAALELGAARVVSLDRDEDCMRAIAANADRFLSRDDRARLELRIGDVLVPGSLPRGTFDIVYAWGSLHHTGSMWQAIANASACCAAGGTFVVALYNHTWTSPGWLRVKRFYHAAPAFVRQAMVGVLVGARLLVRAARLKWSRTERGMTVWYDAVDWLGGLPYEYASREAVREFVERLGFTLTRCVPTRRSGCNEFVFVRRPA